MIYWTFSKSHLCDQMIRKIMTVAKYPFCVAVNRVTCQCVLFPCGRFLQSKTVLILYRIIQTAPGTWASDVINSWTWMRTCFYMCFASFRYLLLQGSYDVATYVLGQVSGLYLRHTWMCIFIAVITNWVLILVINLSKSAEPWLCLRRILLFLNGRITPYHIRRLDLDSIPVHSLVILRCWTLT